MLNDGISVLVKLYPEPDNPVDSKVMLTLLGKESVREELDSDVQKANNHSVSFDYVNYSVFFYWYALQGEVNGHQMFFIVVLLVIIPFDNYCSLF